MDRQELIAYLKDQEDALRLLREYVESGREDQAPAFMLDGYDMADFEADVKKLHEQERDAYHAEMQRLLAIRKQRKGGGAA